MLRALVRVFGRDYYAPLVSFAAGAKDIAIGVASGGQVAFCTKFTK